MVLRHGAAMTWFSIVTVAYHVFFITYVLNFVAPKLEGDLTPMAVAASVLGLGIVFSFLNNRDWLVLAVCVYAISIAAFVVVGVEPLRDVRWSGMMDQKELLWLMPVMVFGFVLCPYLDLTFHRAIQHSPSKHAFGVFGVTFAVMIVLTVAMWYSSGVRSGAAVSGWLGLVMGHILAQSIFTVGAHLREIRLKAKPTWRMRVPLIVLAPLLAAPLLLVTRWVTDSSRIGEDIYIGFLMLYGSLFPIWFLWKAIVRSGNENPRPLAGG